MREPQVDTFCRCVKKVKKTLKARSGSTSERGKKDRSAAEGRAIAICTKSVLQTKGRTLRKVRCRDKVLETQPMKGGKFRWMGADTPVFNNERVDEWNGFPVMKNPNPEQFNGWIAKYNPVVRMVSEGDGELPVHKILRDMLDKTHPFNQPFVNMHFNLVVNQDAIYPVDYNATLAMVKSQNDVEKTDRLISVGRRFGTGNWFGLVTRTQKSDVYDLDPEPQRNAMCAFLRVLLRIDGRMIHADLHRGNMAIMFDGKPVIHDVGRMKIRDAADMPGAPPSRILKNALYSRFDNPNYYMSLSQHFYIARMFKKIRKAYGEVFPKPTAAHGWVQDYKQPTIDSDRKFKAWLDAKATGADESNYVQIARVYDILSVLKGLSDLPRWTAAGKPAHLTAYYYARKAAVNLTNHLFAGYATKENVIKIVRSFLLLSGTTTGQCGGPPTIGQKYEDPENTYAATYMTPEGGFVDETRGNPSAAPPPPPPLRRIQPPPPAPESVDLSEIGAAEKALRAQEDALNNAMIESLSGKGDADAIEKLSAIKAVTETPPDVKAAAAKAFTEPVSAIPAAELEAEDDVEVGLEVRTEDTSAVAKAELAERLLDAQLAQGSPLSGVDYVVNSKGVAEPVRRGGMEGGVFKATGYTAVIFEAGPGETEWGFLPPAAEGAAIPPLEGLNQNQYVAYVSPDPKIVDIHDMVRNASGGPDSPVGKIINTYVLHYPCTLAGMASSFWKRVDGRLERQVNHFPVTPTIRQNAALDNADESDQLECLLVLKFEKTVEELLDPRQKLKALFEIVDGLVELDGAFVINDLHEGNIALMPDGHAVTFDYDRTCAPEDFKKMVDTILEDTLRYQGLPQYKHIVDLEEDADREAKIGKLEKISDILAVLATVETVPGVAPVPAAFRKCRGALWNSNDKAQRHAVINALRNVLLPIKAGHRTPRRRLPQLL
jgi:hypothetical protein